MRETPRRYKGCDIVPCVCDRHASRHGQDSGRSDVGRWFVRASHSLTGIPWDEGECAHYMSVRLAREAISRDAFPR